MRDILERLKIELRLAVLLFLSVLACIAVTQGLIHSAYPSNDNARTSPSGVGAPR